MRKSNVLYTWNKNQIKRVVEIGMIKNLLHCRNFLEKCMKFEGYSYGKGKGDNL